MTDNKRIIALSNQLREEGMQVSIKVQKLHVMYGTYLKVQQV